MVKYADHVKEIEDATVRDYGFRSNHGTLLQGEFALKYYSDLWQSGSEGQARLSGRTPAHLDRDRVLYSDAFREQDDKYHTLYYGNSRRSRNYTTHSLRAAHVGRTAAQRLGLNVELAEAIILASKVGAVPFVHRGRVQVATWLQNQIAEMNKHATDKETGPAETAMFKLDETSGEMILPGWINSIDSPRLRREVRQLLPWAEGTVDAPAYQSGVESYWTLTTNSYLRESRDKGFLAQTMYGAWRHSLANRDALSNRFKHTISLNGGAIRQTISQEHATHEAVLGRYCDDITWVIENLNEAARVAALEGVGNVYSRLARQYKDEFDPLVGAALAGSDSGKLYTYYIDDLVRTSAENMANANPGDAATEVEPIVSLSPRADRTLLNMKAFLNTEVFSDYRIAFRNQTIDVVLYNTLDLIYKSWDRDRVLAHLIRERARAEGWDSKENLDAAERLLPNAVHRLQVTVDILAAMSDREVFNLIGLDS